MYKVGAKVVSVVYGAGTITEIVKEKIDGVMHEFYKIKLTHSPMELLIPTKKTNKNLIRPISTDKQLAKALNILKKEPLKMSEEDLRIITNDVSSIIKNSDIVEIAKWLSKLISRRRALGQPNANEKKLYLNFKTLICGELALIKNIDFKEAEAHLEKILKKNFSVSQKDLEFLGIDENANLDEDDENVKLIKENEDFDEDDEN
ncbi:MAG TPA: CarD family transcriptional regulator [bacterium]|nr:CarD family transcriptional regulator [bacterium]